MKTVVVEGWRFIPHSYAVVNQYQCLELLRRPDIKLYHRDVPYFRKSWTPTNNTLTAEHEALIRSMPEPPADLRPDAYLRMGFPHKFENEPGAARTFTWMTSEFKRLQEDSIASGKKPWEALSKAQATVIACSRWAGVGITNSGLPKSKLVVIPCGVDTSVFRPLPAEERAALRKELGWEHRFVVINISAATHNKGLDLAMRAVTEMVPQKPEILICLKGSDTLYSSDANVVGSYQMLSQDEKERLRSHFYYTGDSMPAHRIAQWYQAADLYISPYRAEGFNLPVLEAAACGLPVICTRGGSTEDFVDDSWCLKIDSKEHQDSKIGWMLEPKYAHLVELTRRAITEGAWRASASAAAAAWVRDGFTWKHSVDKLLNLMFPG
jgi:glycosyltransferase involved in cell wall biosynthesis